MSTKRPTHKKNRSTRKQTAGNDTGAVPVSLFARRIHQVAEVLGQIMQWQHPADSVLSQWMRKQKNMGSRDRAETTNAVFDVLRHLRRYRYLAESGVGSGTRRLAILGLVATWDKNLRPALDEAEQAWLDHVLNLDKLDMPFAQRYSLPDWLAEHLQAMPDAEQLAQALNTEAPLDLRVNSFKADRDQLLAELQQERETARFKPEATAYSPWGIRLKGRPYVVSWPQFEKGQIEIQDEGSQLLTALVAPKRGEMIIDFCAGAGGKTLLLGALMRSTGRLYAFDTSAARLARAKPRFARSGLSNVISVVINEEYDSRIKRLQGKAQRVLVDAPCSGIGTLRRNPDLKWRQHPETIDYYVDLQRDILQKSAKCVAPGGRLVYATCSMLPAENQNQITWFLEQHPHFELMDVNPIIATRSPTLSMSGPFLELRPDYHHTDGFFAAVLQRKTEVI